MYLEKEDFIQTTAIGPQPFSKHSKCFFFSKVARLALVPAQTQALNKPRSADPLGYKREDLKLVKNLKEMLEGGSLSGRTKICAQSTHQ